MRSSLGEPGFFSHSAVAGGVLVWHARVGTRGGLTGLDVKSIKVRLRGLLGPDSGEGVILAASSCMHQSVSQASQSVSITTPHTYLIPGKHFVREEWLACEQLSLDLRRSMKDGPKLLVDGVVLSTDVHVIDLGLSGSNRRADPVLRDLDVFAWLVHHLVHERRRAVCGPHRGVRVFTAISVGVFRIFVRCVALGAAGKGICVLRDVGCCEVAPFSAGWERTCHKRGQLGSALLRLSGQ